MAHFTHRRPRGSAHLRLRRGRPERCHRPDRRVHQVLPRHVDGDDCTGGDGRGGDHFGLLGPPTAPQGDVVGRSPLHVPCARSRVRARDRARTIVRGASSHEVRLVPALGFERRPRARLPIRVAAVADFPAPSRGRRGPPGRAGHGLGHLPGQEPRPPGGGGRSVLRVALPHQGDVVAGPPVHALGATQAAFPPHHGEGHR